MLTETEKQLIKSWLDAGLEFELREFINKETYSIAIPWNIEDVLFQAEQLDTEITDDQAMEILEIIKDEFDAENGITWFVIENSIKEYVTRIGL
jgi:hypothetical protein